MSNMKITGKLPRMVREDTFTHKPLKNEGDKLKLYCYGYKNVK